MKILLINASPKKVKSNSRIIAQKFLEGIESLGPCESKEIQVYDMDIRPCRGCFACWSSSPGECIIKDDMANLIQDILTSDIILFSFSLYYFSLPSQAKTLIDRLLPMNLPFMARDKESGDHPSRYDLSGKKYALISSCGFYTSQGNYDSVDRQFDRILGEGLYEKIYVGQGELFSIKHVKSRTDQYLQVVYQAGREFASSSISQETRKKLDQNLFSRHTYEEMADASWDIVDLDGQDQKHSRPEGLRFTRQMASLYNPSSWTEDKVLEINYTDIKETYQIILKEDDYEIRDQDFLAYTIKINTPLDIWKKIGAGDISGANALMDGLYTYQGDFDILLNWDSYFGYENPEDNQLKKSQTKDPNMALFLIPWIVFWISLPISRTWGPIISIIFTSCLPFAFMKYRAGLYEYLTIFFVTSLSLLAIYNNDLDNILPISYLVFGLIWFFGSFKDVPLSANYSMVDYGYERALDNKIFISTNRIISRAWGLVYILVSIVSYFIIRKEIILAFILLNIATPMIMGIFTYIFQKWYPENFGKEKK